MEEGALGPGVREKGTPPREWKAQLLLLWDWLSGEKVAAGLLVPLLSLSGPRPLGSLSTIFIFSRWVPRGLLCTVGGPEGNYPCTPVTVWKPEGSGPSLCELPFACPGRCKQRGVRAVLYLLSSTVCKLRTSVCRPPWVLLKNGRQSKFECGRQVRFS